MKRMEKACISCRSPKVESSCGICSGDLCRKCRIFLSEEEFPFVSERPADLRHSYYCGPCHDEKVATFRAEYDDAFERSKNVNVIYKNSKSTIRVLKKASKMIKVENVRDRDEVLLRLAFEAARGGYNAIVDVEVDVAKVRNAGWQKSAWSGQGLPASISSFELNKTT